jgi:putative Holliday junction resolvase
MRVLGIDIGLKRSGLALSDELGVAVRRLPNLKADSRKAAVAQILALVVEHNVEAVVIGVPEAITKESTAIHTRASGLAEGVKAALFEERLATGVFLWDESFTSKKALANLVAVDIGQRRRKELLDGESAAVLVEDFLAWKQRK